jgi:hypothetical protein
MLKAKGFKSKLNIMDNQATKHIKKYLPKNNCKLQLVEPHNHHVNTAKQAIQTFKDVFISALAMTDSNFPSSCGINSRLRSRTHYICCVHHVLTHPSWLMKSSMARTIGTDTRWPPLDAKPSSMRMAACGVHGHREALTRGIWACPKTTINVICTTS